MSFPGSTLWRFNHTHVLPPVCHLSGVQGDPGEVGWLLHICPHISCWNCTSDPDNGIQPSGTGMRMDADHWSTFHLVFFLPLPMVWLTVHSLSGSSLGHQDGYSFQELIRESQSLHYLLPLCSQLRSCSLCREAFLWSQVLSLWFCASDT